MTIRYDRLLDCITALQSSPDPSKFGMDNFYTKDWDIRVRYPECILGHYHWMFYHRYPEGMIGDFGSCLYMSAKEHFGLSYEQVDYLFGGYTSRGADGKPTTIKEAIEYIYNFIDNRGETP